ncbi:hypothetical protein SARC_14773 [Sphaeroforma arctica JP610]|uniref:Uncharacterized protein n=1 Tax=Sphaeroforma arctica JP610 TaxID=667725 RepID=A0A0L0F7L6_9EUKA|nr:hypothetical protein SARC_14773 [Sphaeroforma arctica JP610]KNC72664.1 hypothetical protein SARC_14773 [Sphaeroforma arctica JP610]|eukprot:XP_014146566.1 hypothetical protein SARC_14773 [Sphaeroforma arctica JP610]
MSYIASLAGDKHSHALRMTKALTQARPPSTPPQQQQYTQLSPVHPSHHTPTYLRAIRMHHQPGDSRHTRVAQPRTIDHRGVMFVAVTDTLHALGGGEADLGLRGELGQVLVAAYTI